MTTDWIYTLAFYAVAGAALLGGLGVLTLRNLFHAGMALILSLFAVAALFVMLGAEFLAGVQVLIYVGAVAVLILFAVMLTQRIAAQGFLRAFTRSALVAFPVVFLMTVVVAATLATRAEAPVMKPGPQGDVLNAVAQVLLSTYLLPFEVISLLLLGALVGAIVLSRKEERE